MCADSLVSLLPVAYEYLEDAIRPWQRGYTGARETSDQDKHHETETEDRLVPNKWVLVGLLSSVVIGTVLVWLVFGHEGIRPWATLLGFILGGMLSIIGYVFMLIFSLCTSFLLKCTSFGRDGFEPCVRSGQNIPIVLCLDPTR